MMGCRVTRAARSWAVLLGVAFGVSLLMPVAPAAAHNQLTGSSPRDGARVAAAPEHVELRFLARLDEDTTKITITGPDNVDAVGGPPRFSANRVSVPFVPGGAGLYIVGYRLVSADAHPISGEIRFTLTTGTPADPTPEPTVTDPTTPDPAAASPAPTTPSAATPVPRSDESSGGGWWWAAVAALPLLAILVAARLIRRRAARRR